MSAIVAFPNGRKIKSNTRVDPRKGLQVEVTAPNGEYFGWRRVLSSKRADVPGAYCLVGPEIALVELVGDRAHFVGEA